MKQLFQIIMQYIYLGICDNIDRAFVNNTGVDAICILGTYLTIQMIASKIVSVGRYAYRVHRKNLSECLILVTIISLLISTPLIWGSNWIVHLYTLNEFQYQALNNALKILGCTFFLKAIGDFLGEYVLLNERYKLNVISTTIYYVFMILFDLYVFLTSQRFEMFLILTMISYTIYDLFIIFSLKLHRQLNKPKLRIVKKYAVDGLHLATTSFCVELSGLIYTAYASKLGTEMYALHSVCYSVLCMSYYISNSYGVYGLTVFKKYDTKDRYKRAGDLVKKESWLSIGLLLLAFIPLVLALKGGVDFKSCIIYAPLYLISYIPSLITIIYHSYLTVEGKTLNLTICGLLGLTVRVVTTIVLFHFYQNIFVFIIALNIDSFIQMIYSFTVSKKHYKRLKGELQNEKDTRISKE